MNLVEYIEEAISSGRSNSKKLFCKFPMTMEQNDITKWLEENGFRYISENNTLHPGPSINKYTKNDTDRVYHIGVCNPDRQGTFWIQFGTRKILFQIDLSPNHPLKGRSWWTPFQCVVEGGNVTRYNTLEEFASAIENEFEL